MDVFEIESEASKAREAAAAASAASAEAAAAVERVEVVEAGDATPAAGLHDHFKPLKQLPAQQRQQELRKDIHFVSAGHWRHGEGEGGSRGRGVQRQQELHKDIHFVEHTWPVHQLCLHFRTNATKGLTDTQVQRNRTRYGENKLTPGYVTPWWLKYLQQYTNFFSLLLIAAAALCFIAYVIDENDVKENLYLGIVLLVVVVVTATFTFMQEHKSAHIMEGFRALIPANCHVIRNGESMMIDATALVPGDLVELNDGDKVPADIRIISASDLTVDNSALTGESEAVERGPRLEKDESGEQIWQPLEAANIAFYGTIVCSGTARGVVIGTGDNTAMGQIAGLAVLTENNETPLSIELAQFVKMIGLLAVIMGLVFFAIGLSLGDPFIQTVVFGIGVIVANVPEGLLAAVTVSLALAAKRMHRRNVLVKNLQSVETLGSCTTIASDKTGTLTQNRMTVQHCWYDLRVFECPAVHNRVEWEAFMKSPAASLAYEPQSITFQKLQLICTLCNNANFLSTQGEDMAIEMRRADFDLLGAACSGDASEQGLLKFVEPLRSAREVRDLYAKLFEIKFSSTNKWQLSIHVQSAQGRLPPVLVMKGAPERVLARCAYIMVNGQVFDLNSESRKYFQDAVEQLGGYGERVLGMAFRDLDGFANDFMFTNKPEPNFPTDGLTFVGMVGMLDPPREGVPEAVAQCRRAKVRVIMVTGDHPITAKAIALKVGIMDQAKVDDGTACVVTGDDIRQWGDLTPHDEQLKWDEALSHEQLVFARVSPAHKLLIVEHCQRRGEIVAVTGDGVNDAPALKKGDIGIAMGIAGKDVSKEAADMILMDDNFASIVNGVEEGRLIFDNLKKTICYALTVNIPELVPYLVNVLGGVPLALSTVLMLAICLGTDMLPAISLAYEEKESDIMERPPRNARKDHLVSWKLISHAYLQIGVVQTLAGFLAYLAVFNDYGYPPHVLPSIGSDFATSSIICSLNSDLEPDRCGYGCASPDYTAIPTPANSPSSVAYCLYGCPAPAPGTVVADPFSEFSLGGFRGQQYCNLTCYSPASQFVGGTIPSQCASADTTLYGFPNRKSLDPPAGPAGGIYWWGGRSMSQANPEYQRQVLLYAQSAYFVAIIVTQWANLIVCKTRRLSVFQQGMWNWVLNFSLLFETGIAAALLYVPFLQEVFSVRPISIVYWFIGIPFALTILFLGEIRKLFIRRFPGGWMDRWTAW
ncbi:unnamed protein product [Closterium sp. NIES-64]|nr:unnamed protein product [Closterium sp. NIES-64]CAI6011066.1 unnamed protein product [Closterium sp. NIES-65]